MKDKAIERAIEIHEARYVSESMIKQTDILGRNFGCLASSIELIKNETCLMINGNSANIKSPIT